MKTMFAAGMVLVALGGVANADAPGGWDQYSAMMKAQGRAKVVQVQPVPVAQQEVPVYVNKQVGGTWVFPANPNQDGNN